MRVVTLDNKAFEEVCHDLAGKVVIDGYLPDLIVGIATGGVYVSRHIMPSVPHAVISCQRPSTAVKDSNKTLMNIVQCLPLWCRNLLRIVEAMLLGCNKSRRLPQVDIDKECINAIKASKYILVVDDAVDSGNTLMAVKEIIESLDSDVEIRTAAITVTTSAPAIIPDYYIYHNRTLIRFPWSKDAAK